MLRTDFSTRSSERWGCTPKRPFAPGQFLNSNGRWTCWPTCWWGSGLFFHLWFLMISVISGYHQNSCHPARTTKCFFGRTRVQGDSPLLLSISCLAYLEYLFCPHGFDFARIKIHSHISPPPGIFTSSIFTLNLDSFFGNFGISGKFTEAEGFKTTRSVLKMIPPMLVSNFSLLILVIWHTSLYVRRSNPAITQATYHRWGCCPALTVTWLSCFMNSVQFIGWPNLNEWKHEKE